MNASVQYNDFIGTAAADISDHSNLNDFLANRGVDISKYDAIGASFSTGYSNYISVAIICIDKEQSTENKKHIVKLKFESKFEISEFLDLFKSFEVVITNNHSGYPESEIDESIRIDDREESKD